MKFPPEGCLAVVGDAALQEVLQLVLLQEGRPLAPVVQDDALLLGHPPELRLRVVPE